MRHIVFCVAAILIACSALPAAAQRRSTPPSPPNPFANNPQAVQDGEKTYVADCTSCHGPNGTAGEIGPAIVSGELPNTRITDAQIFNTIKSGLPGTLMPPWSGKLSDDDIWKLAAYIHALRGTAIDNPLPGDVGIGEQIFWGKGQCGSCHMINGRGGLTAPDLSNIAGMRKSNTIVDALTKPQHHVFGSGGAHLASLPPMDTYLPVKVTTADGKTMDGVILNEDSYSVQIIGNDNQLHLFDRAKLRSLNIGSKSLMPTDYDKRLAPDEFKDLLAFLTHQGHAAEPARSGRGSGEANSGDPE